MRKIKEALRLKAAGLGNREIAASIGAGKTTVYELLARAEGAGIDWPLADDLDEEQLEAILYPPPSAVPAGSRPVPNWREVHRDLKNKRHHVTLRLLWLEWKESHPDGWGYTQYCWHYSKWLSGQDVVMRLSYKAGERMFVDFSGDTMEVFDQTTGDSWKAEVFVSVLGCSGLLYVEATRGQDLRSWLSAHEHAYTYYGGVAEMTVPDNLKSGITKACFYDPEINPS
jgi:transposase